MERHFFFKKAASGTAAPEVYHANGKTAINQQEAGTYHKGNWKGRRGRNPSTGEGRSGRSHSTGEGSITGELLNAALLNIVKLKKNFKCTCHSIITSTLA